LNEMINGKPYQKMTHEVIEGMHYQNRRHIKPKLFGNGKL